MTEEEEVTQHWDIIQPDDTTPFGDNALEALAELNKVSDNQD